MEPAFRNPTETSSTFSSTSSSSSSSSSTSQDYNNPYESLTYTRSLLQAESTAMMPPPYSCAIGSPVTSKPFMSKAGQRGRRLRTRSLVIAAVSLTVLCLAVLAVSAALLVTISRKEKQDKGVSDQHAEVCMPCDEVRPNPLDDSHSPLLELLDIKRGDHDKQGRSDGNALDVDLDTEICCARTPAQYAALFKLILSRQEEVKKLAEVLNPEHGYVPAPPPDGQDGDVLVQGPSGPMAVPADASVAAHLVLKPQKHVAAGKEKHIQLWKSSAESPLSYVRDGGVVFRDSKKLVIRTPGLYFIYCQILFNKHSPSSSPRSGGVPSGLGAVASSYVMRHSLSFPASSGILLKMRHTGLEGDRHSSYVGGLFFLHTGDQLYVKVSQPEAVSHDSSGSFFGLFKL